jgi:hypothetical protein
MIWWLLASSLTLSLSSGVLQVQSNLKPGIEPCDQALRHGSAAVLHSKQVLLLWNPSGEGANAVPLARRQQITDFMDTLAAATDVILHCEYANTPSHQLQKELARLYRAKEAEQTGEVSGRNSPEVASLHDEQVSNLRVTVSAPDSSPNLRVVELSFGSETDGANLLLTYEPNNQTVIIISPKGERLATTLPDGLTGRLRRDNFRYETKAVKPNGR